MCGGHTGKKSGSLSHEVHPAQSLWTRAKPQEPPGHRFTGQDIKEKLSLKESHTPRFQSWSCYENLEASNQASLGLK